MMRALKPATADDTDRLAVGDALSTDEQQLLGGRSFWTRAFEQLLRYPLSAEYLECELCDLMAERAHSPARAKAPPR